MKIDAHQHFWNYHPEKQAWITASMQEIRTDFLPASLLPILKQHNFDGSIAVQADQSVEETKFLIDLAEQHSWIKAVIGWVDLLADDLEEQLSYWKQFSILKGFRHILQAEEPGFMLTEEFIRGITALEKFGYCYEILIYPKHLSAVLELVQQFPNMRFVMDHIAKPNIKETQIAEWKDGLMQLGLHKNLYCKISGMVTEADWKNWIQSDFEPYLTIVKEAFGIERLIYGSDWPVCLLAADYAAQLNIYETYFQQYTDQEKALIFGGNAWKFYQI
ncbi:MAG: amidohydrolase family protein [Bacteroidota bacterium]